MRLCRAKILDYILTNYSLHAWTHYWNSLRSFIIGEISKEEMDAVIILYFSQSNKGLKLMTAAYYILPYFPLFPIFAHSKPP